MPQSFGTRLRTQRERQAITLAAIAEQTKIHQPLLEELERDDVSRWPSGIFRRAFIRAYAIAIGLKPDDVVREFLERHPDPAEVVTIGATLPLEAVSGRRPPTRLRYLARSIVDAFARQLRRLSPSGAATEEQSGSSRPFTPVAVQLDLLASAHLCSKLAQADALGDVRLLLREAVRILEAVGLILWVWDAEMAELKPAAAEGYADSVLAQLPKVRRDTDNATAAAFRSTQTCAVRGRDRATGALAVPVMSPAGCLGVLAVELAPGGEQAVSVRAVATMFAAQMGRLIAAAPVAESAERRWA